MSSDDIGTATKALADAVTALSRSVGQNFSDLGHDVNAQVSGSLRAASKELSDVSARIGRSTGETARKRSQLTRGRLIDAARKLFAEQGYEGASLGDVATEAGFTKGAVYANFASKEDLLLEVIRIVAEDNARRLAAGNGQSVADVLSGSANAANPAQDQLLATEILLYATRHEDLRPQIAALLQPGLNGIAELVSGEGSDAGPDTPGEADLDTAVGLLAIRSYAQLVAPIIGPDRADAAGQRLIARLLATG